MNASLIRNHDGDLLLTEDGKTKEVVAKCMTPLWEAITEFCRQQQLQRLVSGSRLVNQFEAAAFRAGEITRSSDLGLAHEEVIARAEREVDEARVALLTLLRIESIPVMKPASPSGIAGVLASDGQPKR